MSLYLPPELRWLGYVAGSEWPDGDEDHIWDVSGYWKDAAKALREIDPLLQTAKSQAVSAYPQGSGADGVAKMFDQLLTGEQSLDQLADYMDSLGDAAFNMGTQVQAAKLMVIISLIALAIEIAWAWLFPPTAPAQEAASIGVTQVVVRALAKLIGERILATVARTLGEKFAGLAGKFVLEILKSALISGGVDGAVQLGQMADGKRKNFDLKEFGGALAGGAIAGAGGKAFGDWFGKQSGKLFNDLSSTWQRTGHGALVGIAGGEFGNVAGNLGGALVTGDWSGFANGAGWTGGAAHGGLGGGIRAYRGDFEMPGGTKNFEVPAFGADGGSFAPKPHGFGEEPPATTPAGFHGSGDDFNTNGPYTGPKVQIPDNTHSGQTSEPVSVQVNGRGPGDTRNGDAGGQDRPVPTPSEQKSTSNGNSPQGQGDSTGNGQGGGKSTIPAAGESPDVNAPRSPAENPVVTNDKPAPVAVSGGSDPKKSAPTDNPVNSNEKNTPASNSGNDGNSTPIRSTPVDDSNLSNGPKAGLSGGPGDQKVTPTAGSGAGSEVTGNSSANNRANSSASGLSAGGNGDGTVQRPSLSINTDVPPAHDEVSPLSPGEKSPLTGEVSPMTPVDKSNPWNSSSSPAPNSSPLASDPSVSRPTQEAGSSSPATATGSGSPASNTGAAPPRASTPSASAAGGADPGGPMSASSKGTPSTSSTSGASNTGGTVRSSSVGPSPTPSTRVPASSPGDGSSTPSNSRPSVTTGEGSSSPSSPRPGVTTGGAEGAGLTGGRTPDEPPTPASTSQGPAGGSRGGSGPSNDGPLPPYGSRPNDGSQAPHAGPDGHGPGDHVGAGLVGGLHSGTHEEQPPSWERNPDGSITVHLSDGTEVHVQDGFVFVGSHAGGSAAPHSYDKDGVVRFPRPNGSTVTVKPDGETTVAARGGGTIKYEPDGTKIEFGPGSNHTIVTTPDGIVHRVPNDRQGWTKGEDGFTVTSHDGTTHTVDSDGNIVVKHAGDDHGIKISKDGSVEFVDSDGHGMTPAGRPGRGAGQFDQQTFGRPDRVTHTVLPDGGGVRTTGPDGSTTTVKHDGTTEFKSPSGHTVTHDPEGMKVEFGPEQPTVVTHADGTSHAVPTDKGMWNKNADGDIVASSPDGTAHAISSGGGPMRVGRGTDDPYRFTVHRPGDSGESKGSTGIVGALKSQLPIGALGSKVSDTFGSGNFDGRGVEFHGPGDKSVTVQVSSNGTVKATGWDGSTITVKKNGSAEFVSGDGAKTGFGSGGKESGSKKDWAGNDATWSKHGDDVHMTAPDGTRITVDDEGNILLSHPGDSTTMIKVTPEHDIAFGRPDTTGHTVHPDGTVRTKSPDGTETTVKHDGTMKVTESDGNVTTTKSTGTVVQHSPDGPTVVSGHDGTVQTAHPHGAVRVSEADGTVHTIENAADPRSGRSTKFPDGSTTTVEKGPESPGLKDQILGDGKPPSVGLRRPDDTELVVDNKGNLRVTDPNGTVYEKDSKGNVTVTRPGEDGEAGPIGSKGGTAKLSNGATLENTSDGFKVFHSDSVSEVGKGGVKFTDMRGDVRAARPDGMITVTKPDGSSRDVRSDGSVRDTKPDGTSEGSRPDGTTWTVDENNKVHVNDPEGTQRPPTDRLSPHLTGGQLAPVKSNWTRDPTGVTPPGPIAFEAPHAPVAEEWLAGDPNLQNPPDLQPPPENWPPPWDYNWQPPPWDYYNNWPPPWSHNWDNFPGPHYPGDHSAGGPGGGPHRMPDLSALNNMAREQGAALGGLAGMHVPNLSAGQLAGLSHMANMPGLSNLAGLGGLSPQALSGLSNIPGLSGLSPSQLGGLSQFSPQQLSALSPSQLQALSGLSPARQQALAGLSPQQLAGMSPAQLAGLTGLTPAQQSALSPSQLDALSGLSPAQQSGLAGMPASELAGLSPSQLSQLQGMTPQQLAQLSRLSPQQLADALNAAQPHQGSNGGLGDIAGLQRGLNGLTGTNGLSGLGDDLAGLANSANPALSALTNALTGQHNQMPSLGAQDMLNSLAHNASGTASDGQGAPGAGGSGTGGSGDGAGVSADSAGGQQDPAAQYGPDAAKSMAAIAGDGGGSSGASGDGLANHHPLQQDPALGDQAAQGGMGQGAGGAPGSPGAPGRQPSEGEGGESSKKKRDRKKKEPKKRAIPKSVLMLSPDEEIEADESDAADAAGAEVDVKFTMGGSVGAQAGSGIKVTPEVVTRMPNGQLPGD